MAVEAPSKTTIKMKYTGHMKGSQKVVELPIPLIANSQKLDLQLVFTRAVDSHGPLTCDVPLEWAGALLATGGFFQASEKITPEIQAKIEAAKELTAAKMQRFADDNLLVEL